MNPFLIIAALGWLTSLGAGIALIILAYRTNDGLGALAFFIPFYAVTVGNHRIASPHARWLARVWWAGFIVFLLTLILMPR